MHKGRKETEKILQKFCDIKGISNFLTDDEKDSLFNISSDFSDAAILNGNKYLGIEVAKSLERNFLLALLTGNAVKYAYKKGVKKPIILEMGMGTGLNAIAASAINRDCHYIGVEIDDDCINFSIEQFLKFKIEKNIEIIKGRYSKIDLNGTKANIIINENFGPNLVEEQQIIAANSALRFANKKVIFVPASMRIYGLFDDQRHDFQELKFDKKSNEKIELKEILKKNNIEFRIGCDILDFQGKTALKQENAENFLSHLPVISEPTRISSSNKQLKIILDFKERQLIFEE